MRIISREADNWTLIVGDRGGICGLCGQRLKKRKRRDDFVAYWQKGRKNPRHVECHRAKVRRES